MFPKLNLITPYKGEDEVVPKKKIYICGCGRNYKSYHALYIHIR